MRDHSESNRGRLISAHHHVITRCICKVRLVSDCEWVSACILCVQEARDGSQRMCTTRIILTQNACPLAHVETRQWHTHLTDTDEIIQEMVRLFSRRMIHHNMKHMDLLCINELLSKWVEIRQNGIDHRPFCLALPEGDKRKRMIGEL